MKTNWWKVNMQVDLARDWVGDLEEVQGGLKGNKLSCIVNDIELYINISLMIGIFCNLSALYCEHVLRQIFMKSIFFAHTF